MKREYVVNWQHGTYSGRETVYCDSNNDTETILALAKIQMRRKFGAPLPMAAESFKIKGERDLEE